MVSAALAGQLCFLPNLLAQSPYQQSDERAPYAASTIRQVGEIPGLDAMLERLRVGEQVIITRTVTGYDLRKRESQQAFPDEGPTEGASIESPEVSGFVGGNDFMGHVPTKAEFLAACTPRSNFETRHCSVVYCNHVFSRMGREDVFDCIRHQIEQKRRQTDRR